MKAIAVLFVINTLSKYYVRSFPDSLGVPDHKFAFDRDLFERVLDPELCEEQINYIVRNDIGILVNFLDAGIRIPRGILKGNLLDLGNYYQCLDINQALPRSIVEGKYCMINVPLDQNFELLQFPDIQWPELNPKALKLKTDTVNRLQQYNLQMSGFQASIGSNFNNGQHIISLSSIGLNLALCIPKVCSTKQAFKSLLNITELSVKYNDVFCRLPNDKPWVVGDYVAIIIFCIIFCLVFISTSYDLYQQFFIQQDPKNINKICQSFSVYTNTHRLLTYTPRSDTLECLDGIRTLAMMWVIVGHTFVAQLISNVMANPLDVLDWMTSPQAIWITAAPITVDTFFMLSGLLVVYTTAGKFTSMRFLRNLHFFYFNRLVRMFPILAAMILIQVSFMNWIVDGPYWLMNMRNVHACRLNWWSTLLHIQNYVHPITMCLAHTWYLAVDVQLYLLSPFVLVWVLSNKKNWAWGALFTALLGTLIAATTYNFFKNFPPASIMPTPSLDDQLYYVTNYYMNTLTRASPFFVGMITGYVLHLYSGKQVVLPTFVPAILWTVATVTTSLIIYSAYPIMQMDWDNQLANNFINSFTRPAWAAAIGWLVFACEHGYGGPINWFLSLPAWKALSRLSYAMYVTHLPMLMLINATAVSQIHFSVHNSIYRYMADFTLSVIVAFLVTVLVDSPCTTLIKMFIRGEARPQGKVAEHADNGSTGAGSLKRDL